MSYAFDVFISYPRAGRATDLIKRLHERLKVELEDVHQRPLTMFLDEHAVETGDDLPETLRGALLRSRVIVPLLGHAYLRSSWCRWELGSMYERQQRYEAQLIFPLLLSDGDQLPPWLRAIKHVDVRGRTNPMPMSPDEHRFNKDVEQLAERISRQVDHVPEWTADFPVQSLPLLGTAPHLEVLR